MILDHLSNHHFPQAIMRSTCSDSEDVYMDATESLPPSPAISQCSFESNYRVKKATHSKRRSTRLDDTTTISRPQSLNGINLADIDIDLLLDECLAPLPQLSPSRSTSLVALVDPERTPRPFSKMASSPSAMPHHQSTPNRQAIRTRKASQDEVLAFPLPPCLSSPATPVHGQFNQDTRPKSRQNKSCPPVPTKDPAKIPASLNLSPRKNKDRLSSLPLLPSPALTDYSDMKSASQSTASLLSNSQSSCNWSNVSRSTRGTSPDSAASRHPSRDRAGSDWSLAMTTSTSHRSTESSASSELLTPPLDTHVWNGMQNPLFMISKEEFHSPIWRRDQQALDLYDQLVSPVTSITSSRSKPLKDGRSRTASAISDLTIKTQQQDSQTSRAGTPLSTRTSPPKLNAKKSLASIGKLFNGLRKSPSVAYLRSASPAPSTSSVRPPLPI